jgi:hypothetical protein
MLPLEVEDCTPEFFADAFEADVERAELLDRSSGTTGRARFALTGAPSVPATTFVKLAPFDERQRAFVNQVGMGVAEARFYRDLAWEVPVRVPRAYYADTDDDRYVMVLEDLEASGCWFPNPTDADISARAHDIVDQLGALHAQYSQSPRFAADGDLAWLASRGTGDAGGGGKFVQMAVDTLGEQLPEAFHRIADLYLARAPEIVKLWNSGPRTLVHGDPHLGNLFVDPGDGESARTGFLDWAMLGYSPGMRDVAYVMCNSIPPDVRAVEERALVARYCELVGLDGDDGWEQYRLFAVYSWVCATSTAGMGAKWQPLHIGLGGTVRATEACEHLDCVGLLEHMLG